MLGFADTQVQARISSAGIAAETTYEGGLVNVSGALNGEQHTLTVVEPEPDPDPLPTEVLGSYEVVIVLEDGTNSTVYQVADLTKAEAQSHCDANMQSWRDEYETQYPGYLMKCLWFGSVTDTWDTRFSGYRKMMMVPQRLNQTQILIQTQIQILAITPILIQTLPRLILDAIQ